jgi:hypothetical protein
LWYSSPPSARTQRTRSKDPHCRQTPLRSTVHKGAWAQGRGEWGEQGHARVMMGAFFFKRNTGKGRVQFPHPTPGTHTHAHPTSTRCMRRGGTKCVCGGGGGRAGKGAHGTGGRGGWSVTHPAVGKHILVHDPSECESNGDDPVAGGAPHQALHFQSGQVRASGGPNTPLRPVVHVKGAVAEVVPTLGGDKREGRCVCVGGGGGWESKWRGW